MSDFLVELGQNQTAMNIIKALGLPIPTPQTLAREKGAYAEAQLKGYKVLVGAADGSTAVKPMLKTVVDAGAEPVVVGYGEGTPVLVEAGQAAGAKPTVLAPHATPKNLKANGLVFDATGCKNASDLKALYEFFHPLMGKIGTCGRVVLIASLPESEKDIAAQTAARAVEGFTRSIAKEIGKKGATANVIYVEKGAEAKIAAPLTFFLSKRSAFVDGQPVRVTKAVKMPAKPKATAKLDGKVALVTGAARGIGAATAQRLADEGAHVVCLDVPFDRKTLDETTAKVGGTALPMDVTDANAPRAIADFLKDNFGGVDIVVHNAGVTRDKTLRNMKEHLWDMVLNINLKAILDIDEVLFGEEIINKDGRLVALSSIGGIAGNMGQTNYGATKAGVIGYINARTPDAAKRGITVNAVAPGLIETAMTAAMPFAIREAGRRLSSLSQGGQPEDIAELITFFSLPASAGVTGNVVRCCGQSLVGA